MAAGDFVGPACDTMSVANTADMTIRPASAATMYAISLVTWGAGGAVEVNMVDGTNDHAIDGDASRGYIRGPFHVSYTDYMSIKNISGGTLKMAYRGIEVAAS